MSAIYGDRFQILLSRKERYGIKPTSNGVDLPVGFGTEDEAKNFLEELKHLKGVKKVGEFAFCENTIVIDRGLFGGSAYLTPEKSVRLSSSGSFFGNSWEIIDTIIRYTSLGESLKTWWKLSETDMTEEKAQKRLEEITPLAK